MRPSIEQIDGVRLRHDTVSAAGVRLHVAVAGDGPPVVMLHGFPDHWWSWRHQIVALARAGFSAWAPDMRGYNLSDRPVAVSAYRLRHLVDDLAEIVRATGARRAHIVGHDWGGIVAWTFAGHCRDLIERLVICNAPHMQVYLSKVWRTTQLLRSAYVPLFLLPALPEAVLRARNFKGLRMMFTASAARSGVFSRADLDTYVEAIAVPGALTAGLNYYRANFLSEDLAWARAARTAAPTLVIWGEQDPALAPVMLDGLRDIAPDLRIHRVADAGHWVHIERAEQVNRAIVHFLRGSAHGCPPSNQAAERR